jgi:hypothetical protein
MRGGWGKWKGGIWKGKDNERGEEKGGRNRTPSHKNLATPLLCSAVQINSPAVARHLSAQISPCTFDPATHGEMKLTKN